jgi:ribosomal protein L4
MAQPNQSFELDAGTAKAIEDLKEVFGVKTDADVLRKAIALSRIAARYRNHEDQTITLQSPDDKPPMKISLTE